MTQPPSLPPEPFGFDTDEALSALFDGELAAFAADHGLTETEVRDRLERWTDSPDRLAALELGRAAVGEPVTPLDDLTRRRLVRNALPAAAGTGATSKSGWSWLRISAAAAAAVIVLAGLGAMLTTLGTGDDTAKSSQAGSVAAPEAPRGDLGNLGDVSDPATLRELIEPAATERSAATPGTESAQKQKRLSREDATGGGTARDSTGSTTVPQSGSANDGINLAPPSDALVDPKACAAQVAGTRPVRFFATGTYQGQAVTIVGVDAGGRTIAFVVPRNDCQDVLTSISH